MRKIIQIKRSYKNEILQLLVYYNMYKVIVVKQYGSGIQQGSMLYPSLVSCILLQTLDVEAYPVKPAQSVLA